MPELSRSTLGDSKVGEKVPEAMSNIRWAFAGAIANASNSPDVSFLP